MLFKVNQYKTPDITYVLNLTITVAFWLLNRIEDFVSTQLMLLALSPCLFQIFFTFFSGGIHAVAFHWRCTLGCSSGVSQCVSDRLVTRS